VPDVAKLPRELSVEWLQWEVDTLAVGVSDDGVVLRFSGPPADLIVLPAGVAERLLVGLRSALLELMLRRSSS